jgi:TonB family protein
MRLLTGKRLGQSEGELAAAVLFSLLIHVITFAGAFWMTLSVRPRVYVPPFYRVDLVDLPADLSQVTPVMTPPETAAPIVSKPPEAPKHAPKSKPALAKPAAPARKDAMPELKEDAKKGKPVEETAQPRAGSAARSQEAVSVAVAGAPQNFPFLPYVAIVRDKVERNWNPPPGVKGATVKVQFTIMRSGRVGEAKLSASSGNFYFDQAAMRAILSSSPFPALPDGFFRDYETFSVDLMERE